MNSGFVQVELDPVMREKVQDVSIAADPMSGENVANIFFLKKNFNPYNKHFSIQDKF